jgi:hypothetical protein
MVRSVQDTAVRLKSNDTVDQFFAKSSFLGQAQIMPDSLATLHCCHIRYRNPTLLSFKTLRIILTTLSKRAYFETAKGASSNPTTELGSRDLIGTVGNLSSHQRKNSRTSQGRER